MDKVEVKSSDKQTRKKAPLINYKTVSFLSLLICWAIGIVSITLGAGKLIGYQAEMGPKTVDELSAEIEELVDEYKDKEAEVNAEFKENGYSDTYLILNEELAQIDEEISKATNSRYMKEEGWHNPQNLQEALNEAPEILTGLILVLTGTILFFVFHRLDTMKKQK